MVTIAPSSADLCFQSLPYARGGGIGDYQTNDNGVTSVTPSSEGITGRKRRGSDSRMRHVLDGTVIIATAPDRCPAGQSGREGYQRPRARKFTVEDQDAVRLEADKGALSAPWPPNSVCLMRLFGTVCYRDLRWAPSVPANMRANAHPVPRLPLFQKVK